MVCTKFTLSVMWNHRPKSTHWGFPQPRFKKIMSSPGERIQMLENTHFQLHRPTWERLRRRFPWWPHQSLLPRVRLLERQGVARKLKKLSPDQGEKHLQRIAETQHEVSQRPKQRPKQRRSLAEQNQPGQQAAARKRKQSPEPERSLPQKKSQPCRQVPTRKLKGKGPLVRKPLLQAPSPRLKGRARPALLWRRSPGSPHRMWRIITYTLRPTAEHWLRTQMIPRRLGS